VTLTPSPAGTYSNGHAVPLDLEQEAALLSLGRVVEALVEGVDLATSTPNVSRSSDAPRSTR
jgi:hypothetical protein